jgi:hypothetical protein
MPRIPKTSLVAATAAALMISAGCSYNRHVSNGPIASSPDPLGTVSDPIWQKHEENAEASDFVIHDHEFVGNTTRLNERGEQHVKQIAARVSETPFPVLVEPSSMSQREGDTYGFPVHNNHELDMQRRQLVVRALQHMGVDDAEDRVVVSPSLAPGFEQFEAERAYNRGFQGRGLTGFGGFFGLGGFAGGLF